MTKSKDSTENQIAARSIHGASGRNWLFRKVVTAENAERQQRENRLSQFLYEDEDHLHDSTRDASLLARLISYIGAYRLKIIIAVFLMIGTALLSVIRPWLVAQAIDKGIRIDDMYALRMYALLFIGSAMGEMVFNRARILIMAYIGTKVVSDMRTNLFQHMHNLSLNFHNNYSVGRLMSRLISDVGVLQDFITWWFTGVARSVFILLGIIVAMLVMNWRLALVTFAILPLMILLTNYWRKRVRSVYRAARLRLSLINGYLNEAITGIRVTKSFAREATNKKHFKDLNMSYFDANAETARLAAIFFPGVDLMGSLATALVVGMGGWLVLNDALTAGVLVAFLIYVDRFFEPIREMAERYNIFQATMAASERIFGLMDTNPDLLDAPDAITLPTGAGRVDIEDVHFSYKKGEQVLNGVTINAEPGQTIALVGETGAGKSTIIRLIARFFEVGDGRIRIDGHDIRNVTMSSLRSQMGIVLQDTFIFGGTIYSNIRYGRLEASDQDVEICAKAVGVHQFVDGLPNGYDTVVGENGVNLSMGQRQLISFARALLADPTILILDEATSSIDTTHEMKIQAALKVLLEGRTSFVIAHRLNTIVNADQIVVLEDGRVIEHGSHQDLLAEKGSYYNLYTMQWANNVSNI